MFTSNMSGSNVIMCRCGCLAFRTCRALVALGRGQRPRPEHSIASAVAHDRLGALAALELDMLLSRFASPGLLLIEPTAQSFLRSGLVTPVSGPVRLVGVCRVWSVFKGNFSRHRPPRPPLGAAVRGAARLRAMASVTPPPEGDDAGSVVRLGSGAGQSLRAARCFAYGEAAAPADCPARTHADAQLCSMVFPGWVSERCPFWSRCSSWWKLSIDFLWVPKLLAGLAAFVMHVGFLPKQEAFAMAEWQWEALDRKPRPHWLRIVRGFEWIYDSSVPRILAEGMEAWRPPVLKLEARVQWIKSL